MLHTRIIPVILLLNGMIVQSRSFKRYQMIGAPVAAVSRLSSWSCDEIIYLDISREPFYSRHRTDLGQHNYSTIEEIISSVSQTCSMPLTFGGGIRDIEEVERRLYLGADKVTLNHMAAENPQFLEQCSRKFGSQAIVASVDVKLVDGVYRVFRSGRDMTNWDLSEYLHILQEAGAGEVLLNSIDRDGTGLGFDHELVCLAADALAIPLIALGGAGSPEDFARVMRETPVHSVAAANFFHHTENSVYNLKEYLCSNHYNVRPPLELSTQRMYL